MSWMSKNTQAKAPTRTTNAEGSQGGGGFKNGDKANFQLERIAFDPTDNAAVVAEHGADGADSRISIMWRTVETPDGKMLKSCLFQKLYLASTKPGRADQDAQYLAAIAAIAEDKHGVENIYADLIEADEEPDDELLKELIGTRIRGVVGVVDNKGQRPTEFIRSLSEAEPFESAGESEAVAGSGRRRRGRGGDAGK